MPLIKASRQCEYEPFYTMEGFNGHSAIIISNNRRLLLLIPTSVSNRTHFRVGKFLLIVSTFILSFYLHATIFPLRCQKNSSLFSVAFFIACGWLICHSENYHKYKLTFLLSMHVVQQNCSSCQQIVNNLYS